MTMFSLPLLLLSTTTIASAYLGPTHCTKPGHTATSVIQSTSKGYSTFNHLLFDIVSLTISFKSGQIIPDTRLTFQLCQGSIIDLDDSSVPLGFLPIEVPRLTIQCGDNGKRGTTKGDDACIIRGGGKRNPGSTTWNTQPNHAYKTSKAGILGGGKNSVAQIYVYGESAYEITLKGITFDNSLTLQEKKLYNEYIDKFGPNGMNDDGFEVSNEESNIEQEYDASVPTSDSSSGNSNWDSDQGGSRENDLRHHNVRTLQSDGSDVVKPAHRFASVAVKGKGYGDDAGPRLITIDDCKFESHRGYAILVSPGIQEPDMPMAPEFDLPEPHSLSDNNNNNDAAKGMPSVNLQSSGQVYGSSNNNNNRHLNLLDDGGKFIPHDGLVSYYDTSANNKAYLDSRRVKISNTEFVNNIVEGDVVAGLVTSAYSLTLTNCFFQKNSAKAMIFVYNNEAIVDNTIFAENTVEVSTVIMASPEGSKKPNTSSNGQDDTFEPTHIVERTCFLGSNVGMSNVLVTDVDNTGFGQRDNHAKGTQFTWVSTCEGGAAEHFGNDCLETGNCDGTCVDFTSEKCLADRVNSREYEMFFNAGYSRRRMNVVGWWLSSLGMALVVCVLSVIIV